MKYSVELVRKEIAVVKIEANTKKEAIKKALDENIHREVDYEPIGITAKVLKQSYESEV